MTPDVPRERHRSAGARHGEVRPADPLRCAIGLDVGGTKIAAGLVEMPLGRVLARRLIGTGAARGGQHVLADALAVACDLRDQAREQGAELVGIGVGVAELVDRAGNVASSQTIAWQGLPVHECFEALAPTVVEADVRAAALAEARFGAGRPYDLFAYITLGTGISSCLVQHGQPLAGARGNALVLASSPLASVCSVCGAVTATVLEAVATGPALVARYNARSSRPVTRAEEVLGAAAAGDKAAIDVAREGGEALGNSVAFLVNVLDPEALVVGGGLGQAEGIYWTSFVAALRAHIWADATRSLPVLRAALGGDAGFVGASACAWLSGRRG